jgi:putative toxin-antitoxin system antitoxin component (TIGR02293 family)
MTERTLRRRAKTPHMALASAQSAKVLRFAEILLKAEDVLGSRAAAERWLVKPLFGCEGRTPLDLLSNSYGERMLEDVLGRIEFGVYQ